MEPVRVVFEHEPGVAATAIHTDLQSVSLYRQPGRRGAALPVAAGLGALAVGGALTVRRRRGRAVRAAGT